jgi:hypothetical protein
MADVREARPLPVLEYRKQRDWYTKHAVDYHRLQANRRRKVSAWVHRGGRHNIFAVVTYWKAARPLKSYRDVIPHLTPSLLEDCMKHHERSHTNSP